jgi:hypothetical protein
MNAMLCFVKFACIHDFINVVDAWVNQHVVHYKFYGFVSPWFLLYVWGHKIS